VGPLFFIAHSVMSLRSTKYSFAAAAAALGFALPAASLENIKCNQLVSYCNILRLGKYLIQILSVPVHRLAHVVCVTS
jgi:hypothetical protein